ncbi:hypothetical protein [Bradyrhizobium sp. WBAH30]|uniref:hypothetical protein n=2 Tax=Nitrobacteraceae TaxID=41294 RepID=UPI0023637FC0|nr:hypothetical protein [Bradyrhizobium sp. WBAH30]
MVATQMPLMISDQAVFQQIQNTIQPPSSFSHAAKRWRRSPRQAAAMAGGEALFWFGRRRRPVGLAGVALCHDVLVALALVRARRRPGLAGLTAMLAAHVWLAFEIVFAGHAGSMRSQRIGSQRHRLFPAL